jgi:hypothetical protein
LARFFLRICDELGSCVDVKHDLKLDGGVVEVGLEQVSDLLGQIEDAADELESDNMEKWPDNFDLEKLRGKGRAK